MKLKSLLLGTGVAFAVAMPAMAADLMPAEPVDFVRVCDTFGVGYWFIPGTDTCLKIGGYVRFDARASEDPFVASSHSANWDFRTRARLNIWASSLTDYGTLTAFIRMQSDYDNTKGTNDGLVYLDKAFLMFGPFFGGHDTSAFDYPAGGYTIDTGGYRSDQGTDHVALSFKQDKFGAIFSLEDPRDRNGTGPNNGKWPDLIAALTYADGPFDARLSGAVVDQFTGSAGYAVQAGASLKLDQIAKGDAIRVIAAFAQDAGSFTGAAKALGAAGGGSWNVVGSAQHFWAPTFSTAVTASYVTAGSAYAYQAAVSALYSPAKEFSIGGELNYIYNTTKTNTDTWVGLLRFMREFQ